ncbi:MAG: TonB-dependent receptor, partial [Odoribacter sp.]
GVNTDWIAQPVQTAFNHRHSFNLEGGDNTLRYKLYFGLNQAPGIMKGTGIDNKNGSIDLRYRTNNLLISNQLSLDYTRGDRTSPYGTFQAYTLLNPYYRIYDENGAISKVLDNHIYSTEDYTSYIGNYRTPTMNPMYNTLFNQKDQNTAFEIRNSFRAEYTPIESLRLAADVTLTKSYEDLERFKPSSHTDFEGVAVEDRGNFSWTHTKGMKYNVSLTASYNKVFNSDHLVSLFARYDIDERYIHNATTNVKGFPNDKMDEVFLGAEPTSTNGNEGTTRSLGFVSTVNYSYKQRYAVDASIRIDGSSEFGRNNRFAPFWSAGLRWNIDKEVFIQGLGFIDELVLRGTYGVTGSQGFSPYQSLQMYTYEGMMKLYHSSNVSGSVLQSIGNPDLKWQQTKNWNLGMDFNFFKGFVSGRVEYYKKFTKNTLLAFTLAPSVGFETITDNMGDIDNKGYELTLRLMPYNNLKKQMNFNIVLNGSHNVSKIARISNALKVKNEEAAAKVASRPLPRYEEGYSQSIIWGVRSLGIDPVSGREVLLTRDNKRTFDWNTIDQVPLGDTEPKLQGTLSANFNWKGLSVSVIGGYKFGGQLYNYTLIEKVENANLRLNVDERAFTQRWKNPGDKTFFKGVTTDANGQSTKASSRFVMDNNEFTVSTMNVSYRFERRYHNFIRRIGLSSASVSVYMEDLIRLSTVKMERGIDYPFSRQVSMSLGLVF